MLTFQEYVTHYKGNTTQQQTGLNFQLPDGTPVSLGYDQVPAPTCGGAPAIQDSSTKSPDHQPNLPGVDTVSPQCADSHTDPDRRVPVSAFEYSEHRDEWPYSLYVSDFQCSEL